MKNTNYEIKTCSCGCGKSYPKGKAKPAGWKKFGDSVLRLSDNTLFSKGDVIQRFTEQGKQYCDMIITEIDFYPIDKVRSIESFYIRASTIENADQRSGSTNITDNTTDYESANNPNTLRFIEHTKR